MGRCVSERKMGKKRGKGIQERGLPEDLVSQKPNSPSENNLSSHCPSGRNKSIATKPQMQNLDLHICC